MALSLLFLFLLLDPFCFIVVPTTARPHSDSLVLPLHRRYVPSNITTGIPLDHLKELRRDDNLRQHMIRGRSRQHRRRAYDTSNSADSFRMPLGSAAYVGTGQYFVELQLGTPPQKFLVIVDTGSELTWVRCRQQDEEPAQGYAFRPNLSSSFKTIPCSSDMCKTYLPNFASGACPSPASPCAYTYEYLDLSVVQGVYANESASVTLANGNSEVLQGLVMGCTTTTTGPSVKTQTGVLGLGYNGISFWGCANQEQFGGLFSYCLMDHLSPQNVSSFLSFGAPAGTAEEELRETPLILDTNVGPFYYVQIEGISVDGELLPIPASVWDIEAGGGTLLDSGMTLTMLAEPAYRAVATALSRRLAKMPRVTMDLFEYCYDWTEEARGGSPPPPLPKLAVHFAGGGRLEPPAKSYVIDVAVDVKCLGITPGPWTGESIIGNIMQQEHLWVFDVKNQRLRFGPSTCSVK